MPKPSLVIDASVLGYANEPTELGDACFEVLQRSLRLFTIVFDHEGHIEAEYRARIAEKPRDSFIQRWYVRLTRQVGGRLFYSGALSVADAKILTNARFDPSDDAYVAVAKLARPAVLVHEDSDYCNAEDVIVRVASCRCIHPSDLVAAIDSGELP